MNKELVITVFLIMIWNAVCIIMLQKKAGKNEKKIILYMAVMVLMSLGLTVALRILYTEYSVIYHLKRIGLISLLFCIAPIDYKECKIPNDFLLLGLVLRGIILIGEFIVQREILLETILSEVIALLIIAVISLICMLIVKNSIGAGDIKLMLLMCLFQGMEGIGGALITSMIVSFVIAVFLLITKKKERKDSIPLAPSILVGTYLSVFLIGA